MEGGKLRHRVQFRRKDFTDVDQHGDATKPPIDLGGAKVSIEPGVGREFEQEAGIASETTHTVRMRYKAGLRKDDWLTFGARRFEIVGIRNPAERSRELVLACVEQGGET